MLNTTYFFKCLTSHFLARTCVS